MQATLRLHGLDARASPPKWPPTKGAISSARGRRARGAPAGTRCASMDIKTFFPVQRIGHISLARSAKSCASRLFAQAPTAVRCKGTPPPHPAYPHICSVVRGREHKRPQARQVPDPWRGRSAVQIAPILRWAGHPRLQEWRFSEQVPSVLDLRPAALLRPLYRPLAWPMYDWPSRPCTEALDSPRRTKSSTTRFSSLLCRLQPTMTPSMARSTPMGAS